MYLSFHDTIKQFSALIIVRVIISDFVPIITDHITTNHHIILISERLCDSEDK